MKSTKGRTRALRNDDAKHAAASIEAAEKADPELHTRPKLPLWQMHDADENMAGDR